MKNISADNPIIRFIIKYSPALLVLSVISRTFPVIGFIYYIVPIILIIHIVLVLKFRSEIKIKNAELLLIFIFPVYSLITSLWSLFPMISFQRSLYLLLMYAGIYSIVRLNKKYLMDRNLGFLLPANLLLIVISVFSLLTGIPENGWTGGNSLGFMGFASHQNTLASAILFTLPGVFALCAKHHSQSLNRNDRRLKKSFSFSNYLSSKTYMQILFFLLITLNLILIILTYSRASMLAFSFGFILFIMLNAKPKIKFIFFGILIFLLLSIILIPSFSNSVAAYFAKGNSPLISRRAVLWEPSLEAAKNGGIIGLGYGVSDPNVKTPITTGSYYDKGRYVREKGNSLLAVVEETGLLGLILFLLPVFWLIKNILPLTIHHSLLTAALAAMLVHSQFEAWWVGPGSIQLPVFLFVLFIAMNFDSWKKDKV